MPKLYRSALSLLLAGNVLWIASCGTIIHPERVGQPRGGRLDVSIVLLDGLGLLCFFIPGVVAFVVDFATGAIYLPPGYSQSGEGGDSKEWRIVKVPKEELTRERIEEVVSREVGRTVDLDGEEVRVERLSSIDEASGRFDAARP
jgi:hypothetical protein